MGIEDVQEGDLLEVIEYKEIRRRIDDELVKAAGVSYFKKRQWMSRS